MHSFFNRLPPKIILWGGTGQAKVVRPIIEHNNSRIIAVFDDTPGLHSPFDDVDIYHGRNSFNTWLAAQDAEDLGFCIAIGNPHASARIELHHWLLENGLKPVTLVHETAWISDTVEIGEGCQVLAGAIIQPDTVIGQECIINTKASVDHECILEDGVEIAPGATLCGLVKVEQNAWICAGATILPRVRIGKGAIVGAGAVVRTDVPAGITVVGTPARPITKQGESS